MFATKHLKSYALTMHSLAKNAKTRPGLVQYQKRIEDVDITHLKDEHRSRFVED